MIKNIFWDFDGVILDSNEVRSFGFNEVLKKFPEKQVKELLDYHELNGGLSRYVKFRYFFEQIREEIITEEHIRKLAEEFSVIMINLLAKKELLIEESLNFIIKNYKKFNMHVISGSDQNELIFLCEKLNISKYFKSILGSPTPKTIIVKETLNNYNYSNKNTLFIGDSINDYEAAIDNNILFMGFNNSILEKKSDIILYTK